MESLSILELAGAVASKLRMESLSMDIDILRSLVTVLTSTLNEAQSRLTALSKPISRLPDEILCLIFLSCEHAKAAPEILWPTSSRILARFTLTHVCRRWRNVALSCPFLWSHIHFDKDSDELVRILLERSQNIPIHLTVTPGALKEPIMQEFTSVQDFHVISTSESYDRDSGWEAHLNRSFNDHCTLLETLTISMSLLPYSDSWVDTFIDTEPLMLQGHAPMLKRLSLDGVSWLAGNQMKCLTHLCLSNCDIPVMSLIALLSSNPGLEEFILSSCSDLESELSEHEQQAFADHPIVQLNHMRRLVLSDNEPPLYWMSWLILHVEFPPSTSVRLNAHSFSEVLKDLRIIGYHQTLPDIDAMALTSSETTFGAIGTIKGLELGLGMEENDVRMYLGPTAGKLRMEFMRDMFPKQRFSSVQELWLPCDWYNDYTYLVELLYAFPALKTLVLCQEHLRPLFNIFHDHLSTLSQSDDSDCPCLNLTAVHIFVRQITDTLVYDLQDFATKLSTWRPLMEFDIGFPDSDTVDQLNALVSEGSPLHSQSTYRLRQFSEMPAFRVPPASRMANHIHWSPWGQSFPLSLFT